MPSHRHHWEQRWESTTGTCTFKLFSCDCRQFKGRHYGCHGEAEMRQGELPPEVREQATKYLLELKDRIHDRKYHTSFWKDCGIEECFAIRAALDALKGE